MTQRYACRRRCTLVLVPTLLLCLLPGSLLAGCAASNTSPASNTYASSNRYSPPPDTLPINHPVATTGCGSIPPVAPGSSVDVTIAAHPAESIGNHTRTFRIHVPKGYASNQVVAVVLAFHSTTVNVTGIACGLPCVAAPL